MRISIVLCLDGLKAYYPLHGAEAVGPPGEVKRDTSRMHRGLKNLVVIAANKARIPHMLTSYSFDILTTVDYLRYRYLSLPNN